MSSGTPHCTCSAVLVCWKPQCLLSCGMSKNCCCFGRQHLHSELHLATVRQTVQVYTVVSKSLMSTLLSHTLMLLAGQPCLLPLQCHSTRVFGVMPYQFNKVYGNPVYDCLACCPQSAHLRQGRVTVALSTKQVQVLPQLNCSSSI